MLDTGGNRLLGLLDTRQLIRERHLFKVNKTLQQLILQINFTCTNRNHQSHFKDFFVSISSQQKSSHFHKHEPKMNLFQVNWSF